MEFAKAQNNLGQLYYFGKGVKQDCFEAVKWFEKAATQGNAAAQSNLGLCYYYGTGVEQDSAEAVKWFQKAAEQGFATAQNNLGVCYKVGSGIEKDEAEAFEWFRKASRQSNDWGQYNLSLCYSLEGVSVWDFWDTQWYRKAAEPLRGFRMGRPLNKRLGQPSTTTARSSFEKSPEEFWGKIPVEFIRSRDPGYVILKYEDGRETDNKYAGIHWAVLANWGDKKRKTGEKRMMTLIYTTSRGVEVVDNDTGICFILYGPLTYHPVSIITENYAIEESSLLANGIYSTKVWDIEIERLYEAIGGEQHELLRQAHHAWLAYREAQIKLVGDYYSKMDCIISRLENVYSIEGYSRERVRSLQRLQELHYQKTLSDEIEKLIKIRN